MYFAYEKHALYYTPPSKQRKKTFDFFITLSSGKLYVLETKGWWTPTDRIRETECIKQNSGVDIRYLFSNAHAKIRKGSKTTYAMWCDKHGIKWAHRLLPQVWLE